METRWRQDFPVPSEEDSYVTRREFTKFDYPDRARFSAILAGWIVERGNRRIALRRLG